MFKTPQMKQVQCKKCGKMCEPAILTGDLSKAICAGCLQRPQEGRRMLRGLQKLAEIERHLAAEGVLIGSVGLSIEDND